MITRTLGGKLKAAQIVPPAIFIVIAIVAFLMPSLKETFVLTGAAILMYVILSVSWTLFSGPSGYVSLATAAFYGVGVYATALYSERFPLPVLMLIGGVAAFAIAIIIGAVTLRLRGVYFTIFTFGLVELLRNLITWTERLTTGRRGRYVVASPVLTVYYYLLGLTVLLVVVAYIIKRTRFGKALASIGESEDAAAHIGVNTTLTKLIAFAISSFFMGAVGAAMASRNSYIDPGIAFDTLKSFLPVLMVIFGGMRTLAGPLVGAAVFAYLQELLITDSLLSAYYRISIGAIMIIAILFLPEGLLGLGDSIIKRITRKKGGAADANA